MNGMSYAILAWLPIIIFPQTMAPDFRYGFPASFGILIGAIFAVALIHFLVKREQKLKAAAGLEPQLESARSRSDKKDSGEDVDVKTASAVGL
jgi:ACS family pantothenate transporter-like MFS transporter